MRYAAGLVLLLVLVLVYFVVVRIQKSKPEASREVKGKVIPIDSHRKPKNKGSEQPCSYCKKKNGKLIFYAQDNGTVVGLCKDCRGKAKKRDMLPL
jgi:putative hemolysin